MTVRTWAKRLTGLTVCLVAGCLYQNSSAPQHLLADAAPLPRHDQAPITRGASAIDPPADPVKVEMIPAPAAPAPLAIPVPPLVDTLRAALDTHPAEARKELESTERPQRERLSALLQLAAGADDQDLDRLSAKEIEATLGHLNDLSRRLRPKAALKIDNVCCCQGIHGFGQYDRVDAGHAYRAGAEGKAGERVQVYAEVGNFASKSLGDGRHETRLATALEVHEVGGKCVAKMSLGTCADHSLTPRSDYFLNFQFHVPGTLEPGTYTLRVTVQDVTAGGPPREATASVPLRVRAAK